MLRKGIRLAVKAARRWLREDARPIASDEYESKDARYPNAIFSRTVADLNLSRRAHYVWGVMQGARLASVLNVDRVSVIEFGVAGGNGLVALERIAERVEELYGVGIDVHGFDTGTGLPRPADHRDLPNLFAEGDYPMDVDKLKSRLTRAQLNLRSEERR